MTAPYPAKKTAVHPFEVMSLTKEKDSWTGWYEPTSTKLGYPTTPVKYDSFKATLVGRNKSEISYGGVIGHRFLGTTRDSKTAFTWRMADSGVLATTQDDQTESLGALMTPDDLAVYHQLDRHFRSGAIAGTMIGVGKVTEENRRTAIEYVGFERRYILRTINGCVVEDAPVAAYVSPKDRAIKIKDFRVKEGRSTSIPEPDGWKWQSFGMVAVSGQPVVIAIERPKADDAVQPQPKARIRAYRITVGTPLPDPVILYEFDAQKNACWGTATDNGKTLFGAATNSYEVENKEDAKRIDWVERCLEEVLLIK